MCYFEEGVEQRLNGLFVDLDLGRGLREDVVVGEALVFAQDHLRLALHRPQTLGTSVAALFGHQRPNAKRHFDRNGLVA